MVVCSRSAYLLAVLALGNACSTRAQSGETDGGTETGDLLPIEPDLCAGWMSACALEADGSLQCWGDAKVTDPGPFASIGCGPTQVCALRPNGTVRCWEGEFLVNEGFESEPAGTFVEIHPGYQNACGLKVDGTIECWGMNLYDHLPVRPGPFVTMANAWWGVCGLLEDGRLECWGYDSEKHAALADAYENVAISNDVCVSRADGTLRCEAGETPGGPFIDFDSGTLFNCGVRSNHELVCWGWGGSTVEDEAPAGEFSQVAVGQEYACARTLDDRVECWGMDHYGSTMPPN